MPDLEFAIIGVEAVAHGLTPLLEFSLQVSNKPVDEVIQAVILHVQVQLQPAQRSYAPREKER